MKRLIVGFIIATALACASVPVAKDTAIVGLQASEVALGSAQDQERALCFKNPQTESGPHCTNPLAAAAGLTDARHQSARDFAIAAFSKQKLAAVALQLWQPGTAPPQDLVDYQTDLTNLVNVAKLLDQSPAAQAFLAKVQSAIDEATKAATAVGVK